MDSPLISVVMPVYNIQEFVAEAVQSVLSQTVADFEFIILDDGSTDDTLNIISKFSDPRIILVRGQRLGLVEQLNQGLSIAKAPIVARMDGDDIAHPKRFEMQCELLKSHRDVGVVSSAYEEIDAKGKGIITRWLPESDVEIRAAMPRYCAICHSSAMFRKNLIDRYGGYDKQYFPAEDFELWVRLFPHVKFMNVPKPLVKKRLHSKSVTFSGLKAQRNVHRGIAMKYLADRKSTCTDVVERAEIDYQIALCEYYQGSVNQARAILNRLVLANPTNLRFMRFWFSSLLGERVIAFLRRKGIAEAITNVLRRRAKSPRLFNP